ncbi:hypothetical protein LTR56_011540 [Elasticomyces elasticus]|uniref:Amino acid transporter transmembrane domain-containing protein n=1 Tax=Elasticomyces elasticus TaxID=574655 RepID=A0AAN7VWV2_9PEZI|nr:hypothetical protein LTR56_011540 [Elasticomyces elasticus]KAK3643269.1 hypothetical protein LTR22_015736 [Elasticomyces elasticus]KAK4930259.1 hypothetical protein LTR49_003293 [Elasticomyces elasticus]KAK5706320.1 hypothetical protein LTR97_001308 [Elasticomyces elasticus]KAK5723524.1 hypothetical protein LTR15_005222 [Elasticomyces elasticus]
MSDTPNSQQSRREAAIVDRHLPEGYTAAPEAVEYPFGDNTSSRSANVTGEQEEDSLTLQGGDIHRDIFKIKARAMQPRRAATFSAKTAQSPNFGPRPSANEPSAEVQQQPGGFRRQYVQRQSLQRKLSTVATPVTRNFVSFLELYGSFAGEDLFDEDEDESAIDDEEEEEDRGPPTERRPLLGRRKTTRKFAREGDASTTKTFFTLLKAFIGTGIMFLPKAFKNGGILFSSITLVSVSLITTLCFMLLLQCRKLHGGGGYGDLGAAIVGPRLRSLILASITLSQLGFVCAGIIFTAENLLAFANAVSWSAGRDQPLGTNALIALQFVVLLPMALIRNISKLGPAALLADVFILIGLVYIWYYDIASLANYGIAPSVVLFNPSAFTLTIGSAIFTFEGIGLILPIQSSMKKPEHFAPLLYIVMGIITVIFTSIGALCYATFGDETKIQIISNFPQTSKLVNAVQFLYSLAVLVGNPVQLYPAVRIIETYAFGEKVTGKKSATIKWKKNALRTGMMALCGVIAVVGASDLDKFVAIIGSFACVPLVYIYPPFLHYRGVAQTWKAKALDLLLITVGFGAMIYTTSVTVAQWVR